MSVANSQPRSGGDPPYQISRASNLDANFSVQQIGFPACRKHRRGAAASRDQAIWGLHITAANAYRRGYVERAEASAELADLAEREWVRDWQSDASVNKT